MAGCDATKQWNNTSSNLQLISESPPLKQHSTSDANMPVPSSAARGCTTLLASDRAVRRVQSQQNRIVWSWDQSDLYNLSKHGWETVHLHPCQWTIGLAGHIRLSVLLFTVTAACCHPRRTQTCLKETLWPAFRWNDSSGQEWQLASTEFNLISKDKTAKQ